MSKVRRIHFSCIKHNIYTVWSGLKGFGLKQGSFSFKLHLLSHSYTVKLQKWMNYRSPPSFTPLPTFLIINTFIRKFYPFTTLLRRKFILTSVGLINSLPKPHPLPLSSTVFGSHIITFPLLVVFLSPSTSNWLSFQFSLL